MSYIRELFIELKDKTLSIIKCLESDGFDELDTLLSERQVTIDKISASSISGNEFKNYIYEFDITNLQDKCIEIMKSRKLYIRDELKKISINKNMNRHYSQDTYVDAIYFNKKI